jgi:hypothetical protein
MDISDQGAVADFFWGYSTDLAIGIHIAMQPSHNWRRRYRFSTSRSTPAVGSTFWRAFGNICPVAYFIFTSTDEVHGDTSSVAACRAISALGHRNIRNASQPGAS